MKRLMTILILMAIPVWILSSVYGQVSNLSDKTTNAKGLYQCEKHPGITASWPAKCPICGMNLTMRPGQGQMMSRRLRAENMRRKIMMSTVINVFDPEAILGAKKPLDLSADQIERLQTRLSVCRRSP